MQANRTKTLTGLNTLPLKPLLAAPWIPLDRHTSATRDGMREVQVAWAKRRDIQQEQTSIQIHGGTQVRPQQWQLLCSEKRHETSRKFCLSKYCFFWTWTCHACVNGQGSRDVCVRVFNDQHWYWTLLIQTVDFNMTYLPFMLPPSRCPLAIYLTLLAAHLVLACPHLWLVAAKSFVNILSTFANGAQTWMKRWIR